MSSQCRRQYSDLPLAADEPSEGIGENFATVAHICEENFRPGHKTSYLVGGGGPVDVR